MAKCCEESHGGWTQENKLKIVTFGKAAKFL